MKIFTLSLILIINAMSISAQSNQPKNQLSAKEAMSLIKPFYDFLGGESSREQVKPSYHPDWKSYYDETGYRDMDQTLDFISGPLAQMVPNLKWEIKEIYLTAQNDIIVRGEATGTPVGDTFMGTPLAGGKSFKLMSIDVHELENGKIIKTYHVEDWLAAIQQVAATN